MNDEDNDINVDPLSWKFIGNHKKELFFLCFLSGTGTLGVLSELTLINTINLTINSFIESTLRYLPLLISGLIGLWYLIYLEDREKKLRKKWNIEHPNI